MAKKRKKKASPKKNAKRKLKRPIKRKAVKRRIAKRKPARKGAARAKKTSPKKKSVSKKLKQNIIGTVTHYFPKVRAAVVKLKRPLSIGDVIKVKGHTTDFTQNVTSLQIDRMPITTAKKGQEIGLQVESRVRRNDTVYKA